MKAREAEDWWRRVYRGERRFRLLRAELSGLPGIGKGVLELGGALSALCGRNGSGKTRVIRAIAACLSPTPLLNNEQVRRRLDGAHVSLSVSLDGRVFDVRGVFDGGVLTQAPGDLPNVVWVDPQLHCVRLAETWGKFKGLNEALAQVEGRPYGARELAAISYVVGREYEAATVWETESDEVLVPAPYFRVRWRGQEYGAEDMGLGELCAHYLWWTLSCAPEGSLILLEEPEAFLIPRSQACLMNELAQVACKRRHTVLLTTHSADVLDRFPLEHVRVLERTPDGFSAQIPGSRAAVLRPLGLEHPKRAVLLAEDVAGASLMRAMLEIADRDALLACEISICGGETEVKDCVELWPLPPEVFRAIGVLDGNGKLDEPSDSAIVKLPSLEAPEVYLRRILRANFTAVAQGIGVPEEQLREADANLEGEDHHDWLPGLARRFGVHPDQVVRSIVSVHISKDEGRVEVESFVTSLRKHLPSE